MDKKALHEVAAKARCWILRFGEKEGQTRPIDTTGLCAIATAKLYELLKSDVRFSDCELTPTIVDCYEGTHAFLVVSTENDDLIVDVTADQFGSKPIEIRSAHNKKNDWYWGNNDETEDDDYSVICGIKAFTKEVKKWDIQSPLKYGLLRRKV